MGAARSPMDFLATLRASDGLLKTPLHVLGDGPGGPRHFFSGGVFRVRFSKGL